MLTIEAEVVVDDSQDSSASSFAPLARETFSCTRRLSAHAFREPADEKTKAGPAHSHCVLLIPEALRKLVVLHMDG